MTDWKYAKRGLMKAGYTIERSSGHGTLMLKKENRTVLMWIDNKEPDAYWYLFFNNGHNTSFHRKGFAIWEEVNGGYNNLQGWFDMPEHVLEYGRHYGHHVNLDEIVDIVFTAKEES